MGRHSKPIPDPERKGITHYVNGKDRTEGMHPGIRKNCVLCTLNEIEAKRQRPGPIKQWDPIEGYE
jgi:hypothetical protein